MRSIIALGILAEVVFVSMGENKPIPVISEDFQCNTVETGSFPSPNTPAHVAVDNLFIATLFFIFFSRWRQCDCCSAISCLRCHIEEIEYGSGGRFGAWSLAADQTLRLSSRGRVDD